MQRRSSSTPRHCFVPPPEHRVYGPTDIGIDLTPLFGDDRQLYPGAHRRLRKAPLQMLVSSIDYNEYVRPDQHQPHRAGTIRQNQRSPSATITTRR